ncbi:prepilin-type N-terminal cleavage/methylation domain-containing protein [Coraliomargarita sp. SDUM461004]|uniref:Prepilin-type N-terminal cleavage/methylation domain-containing protein n=1 Tax=Thalassobacterium sedimentorum TaxID=3041258 RepID=A0ABU1AIR4_9BACT|nr:prepilin-type N-terminal cleavage/methylation domain-containing protein [Coraliomargarita sp. SDUM461004]MDQ8194705.1 prepilin-type N-terminal cleavage/methylation domain-containing protein [Coraliomargarita sp. SDUM461004]
MKKYSFHRSVNRSRSAGFSLIEVVLAIGIFLITVLALVGLLAPTLKSVDDVEKTDEISSIVNSVNAFLQNSPEIANAGESKFATIFNAVVGDDYAQILAFRQYEQGENIGFKIGFIGETNATVTDADITNGTEVYAAGPIYRVVLSASSVTPESYLTGAPDRNTTSGVYTLSNKTLDNYLEGYFAMEVRIYVEDPSPNYDIMKLPPNAGEDPKDATLVNIKDKDPIFTYNTAIVR